MAEAGKLGLVARLAEPKTDLRAPQIVHEIRKPKSGFETRQKARVEDALRRKLLSRAGSDPADARRSAASDLASRLKPSRHIGELPDTLASMRTTRHLRRAFCGHVIDTVSADPRTNVRLYTIVSPAWVVAGAKLASFEPKKLLELLRAQLYRRGLSQRSGWIVASVHGDYDERTDTFHPHVHLFAADEVSDCVESLRDCTLYLPGEVKQPIVGRSPDDLSRSVPYYLFQPFWPRKVTAETGLRLPGRYRIAPNRLVDWLLWIDRRSFSDLVWMHGCRVVAGKIVADKR